MKFLTGVHVPIVLSLLPSLACAVIVSYDEVYDVARTSLSTVACSDGSNGMMTRGFTTFGSLPIFPYIGGSALIAGWNSPNCGSCRQLTYTNTTSGARETITVLMIDSTNVGYNIALAGMNKLTGGRGKALGRVNVTEMEVKRSVCGL